MNMSLASFGRDFLTFHASRNPTTSRIIRAFCAARQRFPNGHFIFEKGSLCYIADDCYAVTLDLNPTWHGRRV